jgi:tetratricopeptide (TPR) repeat protein
LKLVAEGMASKPDVPQAVELRLVEAGVRLDAGQADEALRLLRATLEQIGARGPKLARARLRFAYADLLESAGELELAERWFESAAALDVDQLTGAAERAEALQGVTILFDDSDEDDDEAESPEADAEQEEPGE